MNWHELIKGSELYHLKEKRDHFYDDYMKNKDWHAWESPDLPDSEVPSLFTFLNQWSTHYPSRPEQVIAFKSAYKSVFPAIQMLKDDKLEDVELSESKSGQIESIFMRIAHCGSRDEATGASKILHTILPNLFVMWDTSIGAGYAVTRTPHEYAYRFLGRIQKQVNEAILSYVSEFKCSREAAVSGLISKGNGRTLTKLIDEYNYAKFTLGLDELWDC